MNVHTFKDVVKSKRSSLANELDDDEDDDNERVAAPMKRQVEGEEEEGDEKFNEAGEVMEAFNLRDERDGGFFDENMNYVFKKEKGEVDAWVAEMDEATMEQAIGEAARAVKRKAIEREREEARDALKEFIPSIRLKQELLTFMQPKETVSAAMRRLSGKNADTKNKDEGVVRRRAPPTIDSNNNSNTHVAAQGSQQKQKEKLQQQRDARAKQASINRVTEIADELVTRGLTGLYSMPYEAIKASTLMWEYKGLLDGNIYGPYTAQQLAGWKAQGFFAGPTAVLVRPVGENHLSDSHAMASSSSDPDAATALKALTARTVVVDNDSIYDDDVTPVTVSSSTQPAAQSAQPTPVQQWLNSDEVNFGEYVNLDAAHQTMQQPQRKQARTAIRTFDPTSSVSGGGSADSSRGAGGRPLGKSLLGDAEDDDDDEGDEGEVEGMSYRKAKSGGRMTKEMPDSDDDDQ